MMFSIPYTAPTKWLWSMASLPPVPTCGLQRVRVKRRTRRRSSGAPAPVCTHQDVFGVVGHAGDFVRHHLRADGQ